MEITALIRFYREIYGGAPAKGYLQVLMDYIQGRIDKDLLSFADLNKKKNQTIEDMVTDILSVFHRDEEGRPVIGSWMVSKMLENTGLAIFNAMKNKTHPKKELIPMAVHIVEPFHIPMYNNGDVILSPSGVETYAVSIPAKYGQKKRSFFTAYEWLPKGTEAEFTVTFDDDIVTEELAKYWLHKSGFVGLGPFRERFGRFHVLNL